MTGKLPKTILIAVGIVLILLGLIFAFAKLQYGKSPLFPHKRITITLPYGPENEIRNLIPMGETIEHNFKGGHPGIDFQWSGSVPLIAVADGKITRVYEDDDKGETVFNLVLSSGEYEARYKELDKLAAGIQKGSMVKRGDIIAYPHCSKQFSHCQLHWEFAYSSPLAMIAGVEKGIDRLCPLTYFYPLALARINASWNKIPLSDKFKRDFPHICSGDYLGHDQ